MSVWTTKTAIGSIVLGLLALVAIWNDSVSWLAWADDSLVESIMVLVGSLTGVAMRAAVSKTSAQAIEANDVAHLAGKLAAQAYSRVAVRDAAERVEQRNGK